jgi:UDP-galactopyranose mutase
MGDVPKKAADQVMQFDYLVVGSGLTGAVIARNLKDSGCKVQVVERRSHLGGNVHDSDHPSGIRLHSYGPHYFRTNDERIWAFVNRFGEFYPYVACLKSFVDGCYENWPIAGSYIRRVVSQKWKPEFRGVVSNFEDASLAMMPRAIYEKFVKGYTEKQWGVPARTLSADLAMRFDVREDDDPRLVKHKFQGIPVDGYAAFMANMLRDIPVTLNCDFQQHREAFCPAKLTIFTGPIDAFFGFDLGRLAYRGQKRTHSYHPDIDFLQPCGQVNNPDPSNGPHIRTLEWKHMMLPAKASAVRGTVVTREVTVTPTDQDAYEYPVPDAANARLFQRYRDRAKTLADVLICGRLGEYRYYDMDQAIGRAQMLARKIAAR